MSTNATPVPAPENVIADPRKPWKAYAGAAVTLLGLLWSALSGRDDLGDMNAMEWASVIVPTILTFAAVYGIENPKVVKPVHRGEHGRNDVLLALVIVAVAVLLVIAFRQF